MQDHTAFAFLCPTRSARHGTLRVGPCRCRRREFLPSVAGSRSVVRRDHLFLSSPSIGGHTGRLRTSAIVDDTTASVRTRLSLGSRVWVSSGKYPEARFSPVSAFAWKSVLSAVRTASPAACVCIPMDYIFPSLCFPSVCVSYTHTRMCKGLVFLVIRPPCVFCWARVIHSH